MILHGSFCYCIPQLMFQHNKINIIIAHNSLLHTIYAALKTFLRLGNEKVRVKKVVDLLY